MSEWELDLLLLIGMKFLHLRDMDMELDMPYWYAGPHLGTWIIC